MYHQRVRRVTLIWCVAILAGCSATEQRSAGDVELAFREHRSNVQVAGSGTVERILRDDTSGLPHQRFIVRLASGQTVLVEHNVDVAPRIDNIQTGDAVNFFGEYIWNDQGGLIHWTHHDPAGRHVGGWVEVNGKRYD
jgi:hypothetical protein